MLLTAMLKQLGVKTIWEAADGAAGIEQVSLHKPDFVLLDLNLPEVSGLVVLEKLKAANRNMPVIVVSAQTTVRTVNRAMELGADGYVVKYAQKTEVIQMLSDVLDRIAGESADKSDEGGGKPQAPS